MADVKICGISTIDDLNAVQSAGARWTGFVFFPKSPRHLSLHDAQSLRSHLDAMTLAPIPVALVVNADDDELEQIMTMARPGIIQCHGDETPERLREIKNKYSIQVMKAIRVKHEETLIASKAYDGIADMMLFDSAPTGASLPGGTGHQFDWALMKAYDGTTPWMLAGGLTPDNVAEAIRISGANAVDVSSGVEESPGKKDPEAIHRFVSAAL